MTAEPYPEYEEAAAKETLAYAGFLMSAHGDAWLHDSVTIRQIAFDLYRCRSGGVNRISPTGCPERCSLRTQRHSPTVAIGPAPGHEQVPEFEHSCAARCPAPSALVQGGIVLNVSTAASSTPVLAGLPTARAVDHYAFTVPDLDQAIAFFTGVMGGELCYREGPVEDPVRRLDDPEAGRRRPGRGPRSPWSGSARTATWSSSSTPRRGRSPRRPARTTSADITWP